MRTEIAAMVLCGLIASSASAAATTLEVMAELNEAPGNIAVTADGRIFLSLHQFFSPETRVVELLDDGRLVPFPNKGWNRPDGPPATTLDSVLGIVADTSGTLWMLDNGMRRGTVPRLIAWDLRGDSLARVIQLPPPITPKDAFVNDLAVDRRNHAIYIADPAGGANAALIIVDLGTGKARRVLEGHESLVPEEIDLVIDGRPIERKLPDGEVVRPHIGVNPIALDPFAYWLYYGPMHGASLYRVRTADLRNEWMDDEEISGRVERYSDRPICDGIATDRAGNIYLGDLANNGIGVITRDRRYSGLITDARLSWVDAFCRGPDGKLYAVANQLHRAPLLNQGRDRTKRPFLVVRFDPLPPGTFRR